MSLKVVILGAGKGTRMRSKLPKVLQPLAQKPLLQHVIDTSYYLKADQIITVVGHGAEQVKQTIVGKTIQYVTQADQLGTGHAVQQAIPFIDDDDQVLILYGDVPLTSVNTLKDLLSLLTEQTPLSLLTITLDNATGYGRIVRDQHHRVAAIVEEKDATNDIRAIKEVNTGMLAANGKWLKKWLIELNNDNVQKEYYLTDIIAAAVESGFDVHTTEPQQEIEVLGVNNKQQLQGLERRYQLEQVNKLMAKGVTLLDASRVDVRGEVSVGMDVSIDTNVILEGTVALGNDVKIGANCVLKNVTLSDGVVIHPFSHLEDCLVGEDSIIGPYARLRPGTELAARVKIGNFVETKIAQIGSDSKINHLSYVGDTTMGAGCNLGAGTITCNYDGVNKYTTEIGDGVFVGSDTQLIAPVKINDNATIGAGSTITKEAPADTLTLSRTKQITVKGWQKPQKNRK